MTPGAWRSLLLLVNLGLLAVLAWTVGRFLAHGGASLFYRYALDFGEGIVWQQALLMPGPLAYGAIDRAPFIVFHYPPLFHLAARMVAASGIDGLAAGRLVSLAATLATAACLSALTWQATVARHGRSAAAWGAAIAFALPLGMGPVFLWAPLMRVDMLAVALGFGAMLAAAAAPGRKHLAALAGLLSVAALFTKQTAIAAPAAAFAILLLVAPRDALRAGLIAGAAGLAALLGLTLATDGGFLRHVVGHNVNRYDLLAGLHWIGIVAAISLIPLLAAATEAAFAWRELAQSPSGLVRRLRTDRGARVAAMLLAYLGITTLMLPLVGKSGAGINYFIEWSCALAVLTAMLGARVIAAAAAAVARGARPHLGALVLPAALALLLVGARPQWHPYLDPGMAERVRGLAALEAELRASGRTALSDEMVLLIRAGSGVVWESAIFAELASLGRWDQAPLLAMLAARDFAFVATDGLPEPSGYGGRWTPEVSAAIAAFYPRRSEVAGGLVVHRPP